MYEAEANFVIEPLDRATVGAAGNFDRLSGRIRTRTNLSWSEHCTECAWPTCYSTCDLYTPREDGRCRRFVDGMVRVECPDSANGYLLKIRFKKWGKLWTPGNLLLRTPSKAGVIESRDHHFGRMLHQLPLPIPVRSFIAERRYGLKKRTSGKISADYDVPTSFVLESFNPTDQPVSLSLTIRAAGKGEAIPFQRLIDLLPGFNLVRVAFPDIASLIDPARPFNIEIIPNHTDDEVTLYFGLMDFIEEHQHEDSDAPVKCVVWDLDNTVWDGVLIEDGTSALRMRAGVREMIEVLDRHGILQSVASKNDHGSAMEVLRRFEIDHVFLFPQISWSPKGDAIKEVARKLNISTNTIVFVDDSEFERQQVKSSCPQVRVVDASDYGSLSTTPELQQPITEESKNRRKMYTVEQGRRELCSFFREDYRAFLKNCEIKLRISSLTLDNLERVHELTQRTNQMNFSGIRYDRDSLREIAASDHLDTYILECVDKFGTYGIVGFGIVDRRTPLLTDLMFSCRIQAKRVEHAFLAHIMSIYLDRDQRGFCAHYRKTPRNEPSGRVFADLGMEDRGELDGVTSLFFPADREVPDDGLMEVLTMGELSSIGGRS